MPARGAAEARRYVAYNQIMTGFFKKHKIATVALTLFGLIILYYVSVVIKAYIETPKIISKILASDKMVLRLEDFPDDYLHILLTVEDPNFYSHNGVDLSTPGAGITTVTQGIVKYHYFEHFKPGIAKLKQSLMALVLNARVDKNTQLRIFVNTIYMGTLNEQRISGFSDAARVYYGKNFSKLSRDEYLSLVAMIVGPDGFNVQKHPAENAERMRRIKRLLNGECQPIDNGDVYYEACK